MMLEYVAAAAAGQIRSYAPASHQTVVLSLGAEDDASFASVATSRLPSTVRSLATIIGIELICAARALRLQNRQPDDFCNPRFRRTLHAGFSLPPEVNDRDLRADVEAACGIVLNPIRDEK
jgi:histidine ammonia-lyase